MMLARSMDAAALAAAVAVMAPCPAPCHGQPLYPPAPDWESANPHFSTGAALVDLDRDGFLDLVVADGNDMQVGRLKVYYNRGDGTLPVAAGWQSGDLAYNGHLDVADVNGDGWMDVAVSHLGEYTTFAPIARVYLNDQGTLSSLPDWSADVLGNAFGVAFGDVNGDGRPDLAVGTGWAYTPQQFYHNYVYLNTGTSLAASPSWESDDMDHFQGVLWADADDDGRLDLVGIGAACETQVYRNIGGVLETTASWATTDSPNQDGIMVAVGDVDGDGRRDLVTTDNTQLVGSGLFKLYAGAPGGFFETTYSWSYFDGYGSAVALADVNDDGMLDLATGAWWDHARVFLNTGGGLPASPSWSSGGSSVVEKIVFGDLDPPCGQERVAVERFLADGGRTLFHLPDFAIQAIDRVTRDGVDLAPHEYVFSRERGWVSVGALLLEALVVQYRLSASRDMVVSNWDSSVGNHLYYSLLLDDCNGNGVADGCDVAAGTSGDLNGNGVPDDCECLADVDGSGGVGFPDLLEMLAAWGPCDGCDEDVDGDRVAGFADLLFVLASWGPCS